MASTSALLSDGVLLRIDAKMEKGKGRPKKLQRSRFRDGNDWTERPEQRPHERRNQLWESPDCSPMTGNPSLAHFS